MYVFPDYAGGETFATDQPGGRIENGLTQRMSWNQQRGETAALQANAAAAATEQAKLDQIIEGLASQTAPRQEATTNLTGRARVVETLVAALQAALDSRINAVINECMNLKIAIDRMQYAVDTQTLPGDARSP